MKIDSVWINSADAAALYVDQQLVLSGVHPEALSILTPLAEALGIEYEEHEVDGDLWEYISTQLPHLLGDALREGNLEAAQPVSTEDLLS